jgi:Transcription factor WhiB
MTIAQERPLTLTPEVDLSALPSRVATVCRRTMCTAAAGPDGLCAVHGAAQALLRASAICVPEPSASPEPTSVKFVANIMATKVDGWRAEAACRGRVEIMHPNGRGTKQVDYRAALALCARCPVVEQCREAGVTEKLGVWGGTTPSQRFPRRRRRASAA